MYDITYILAGIVGRDIYMSSHSSYASAFKQMMYELYGEYEQSHLSVDTEWRDAITEVMANDFCVVAEFGFNIAAGCAWANLGGNDRDWKIFIVSRNNANRVVTSRDFHHNAEELEELRRWLLDGGCA